MASFVAKGSTSSATERQTTLDIATNRVPQPQSLAASSQPFTQSKKNVWFRAILGESGSQTSVVEDGILIGIVSVANAQYVCLT